MKVLKFSTPSCGQCKVVEQMLKKANIEFEDIDCTTEDVRCEQYSINHVPTVIIIDDDGANKRLNNIPEVKQWLSHN